MKFLLNKMVPFQLASATNGAPGSYEPSSRGGLWSFEWIELCQSVGPRTAYIMWNPVIHQKCQPPWCWPLLKWGGFVFATLEPLDAATRPFGSPKGADRINQLGEQNDHQRIQVPKIQLLYLIRLFWGWGLPLHKTYTYSLFRWVPLF